MIRIVGQMKTKGLLRFSLLFSPLLLHENYKNVELYQTEQKKDTWYFISSVSICFSSPAGWRPLQVGEAQIHVTSGVGERN